MIRVLFISIFLFPLMQLLPAADAAMVCGDGHCEYTETVATCPSDCADLACAVDADCLSDEACDSGTCRSNCAEIEIDLPCGGSSIIVGPALSAWDTFWRIDGMEYACIDGVYRTQLSADNCTDNCGDRYCHSLENENCDTCPIDCGVCTDLEPANLIEPVPWVKNSPVIPDPGEGWDLYDPYVPPVIDSAQSEDPLSSLWLDVGSQFQYLPVIDSEEVTFKWTAGRHGNRYMLSLGTCLDGFECSRDIFLGDNVWRYHYIPSEFEPFDFPNNGPHSHTVNNIPLTGDVIYVQLVTYHVNGSQHKERYAYRTVDKQTEPHISPKPGVRLVAKRQRFQCSGEVSECEFYVLSRDGSIFYGSQIDVLNYSNVYIPLDGSDILVLWKYIYQNEAKLEQVPYETIRCGNGILSPEEGCDWGEANGQPCTPEPGKDCSFCSEDCRLLRQTGKVIIINDE